MAWIDARSIEGVAVSTEGSPPVLVEAHPVTKMEQTATHPKSIADHTLLVRFIDAPNKRCSTLLIVGREQITLRRLSEHLLVKPAITLSFPED